MNRKLWLSGLMTVLLLFSLTLAACGDDDNESGDSVTTVEDTTQTIKSNPANGDVKIVVGSKNFTEQKILGEIFAQGLAAAGYDISTELNLGDEKTALKAIKSGTIDAYPEYTGTALGSFFDVASEDIPTDPQAAFEQAEKGFAKEGLTALPPTPFTSSNEVALTADKAEELGVEKISDLQEVDQDLTLYGSPECRQRQDCLLGLQQTYDLEFGKFTPVAIDLRHQVLEKGQADLSIVFTTDPQNERNDLVLLEDDKGMFPPYNSTLVVRDQTVEAAGPDMPKVVAQVEKGLTGEVMSELNARVDLDKKTPKEVATEYLQESGLID
ncbi:MAG TPA: glycine betaine ABC transporter substrate-binding protein [Thermoleophilaceae bacterium]|nr:glycine betaine ABC transporter substrate-binding protein [Thermoleophilaceae bacterium]